MQSKSQCDERPEAFANISEFWSIQLNNEIYLRNHKNVIRGSKQYFDIILSARKKYLYYVDDIITYLKGSPTRHLLEVGCGMGTDALIFAREKFNVTGIDLAPGHLELAERLFNLYQETGVFQYGNAESLSFPDKTFGCVYSLGVLHHTPNTQKAIKEIYRVLIPGGRAVIMLYNKLSLNNFVHWITRRGFENAKGQADAPITQRFTKREILATCSDFHSCNVSIEYLFGAGWGKFYNYIPKRIYHFLSKWIGWHLVIYLQK
jgi:ubiquinone/menaquinone biosynthesis C-methylase UbiE